MVWRTTVAGESKRLQVWLYQRTNPSDGVLLCLRGTVFGEVGCFKCVLLHKHLTWSEYICSKAKQILGLIYRQFYNSSSQAVKQLYLSFVQPHLECVCRLWDPYIQQDINKLESTQKFTLKLISHRWDASYAELTRLGNVPMLSKRRLHLKLAQVYKILHGLCDFPDNSFQTRLTHSSRLARSQTLYCPFAQTITTINSFVDFVPSSIRALLQRTQFQFFVCSCSCHLLHVFMCFFFIV